MASSLLLTFAALLVLYFVWHGWYRFKEYRFDSDLARQHGCLPPPRLINQRPFGVDRLEQIWRADRESRLMELFLFHFKQTGNTLEQVFLGTKAFGTIDPENMEALLSKNFKDIGMGPRRAITYPLFGDGIFTQEGAAWKHSRDLLRPQFSYKQYENLEVFREHVDHLLENLPFEGVVDLQPLFFRLTLDTTTGFLFGESVCSLNDSRSAGESTFAGAFNIAQEYVVKRFRLLDLYWLIGGQKFHDSCAKVHRFADATLSRSLDRKLSEDQQGTTRYVFLDRVAQEYQNDRQALRHQMINILAAGRDTTACLLSWTFFLLVRHPAVLEKLREEINNILGPNTDICRTDLQKLQYLQNILKESTSSQRLFLQHLTDPKPPTALRLYPSLPVNTRTAARTTVLPTGGGPDRKSPVLIPKGSAIAYSVYAMHRRADLFGLDAELFRPERWDEPMGLNRDETTATWGYLPFNKGPRICLGMDFALTEAAYTVVRILQRYRSIAMPLDEPLELVGTEKQTMTLVIQPANGCRVDLRP